MEGGAYICVMKTKDLFYRRLPSFQSRVHSVHTTLKPPRKPMATAIRLLLPTYAQVKAGGFVQKSKTQFLPESKPHAQKLLTQFLRHLPTHHPEVETNRKMLTITKSEISAISVEKNIGEWYGTACNERFGAMAGVTRWIVLPNSKLSGSWQVQVARHCAKPPPRYLQWRDMRLGKKAKLNRKLKNVEFVTFSDFEV